jgi:hypothetical protein
MLENRPWGRFSGTQRLSIRDAKLSFYSGSTNRPSHAGRAGLSRSKVSAGEPALSV